MLIIIIAAVVVLFAVQLARAQELQIDFDGNSSKSITKLVDFRGPQKPVAKITVKVVSDDGVIELVEPRVDRYEDKHYQFTPGKNHAMIDYVCPGPVGQLNPWYLKFTPPVSNPQEAGHNHALPDILKSKECKQIKNHPCEAEPTVKYAYTIDGSPWQGTPDVTGMVVSPQLKLNSVFTLSVDIPKYATQLVTHVELVCGNGKSETDYMEIMVPGLQELPASSFYVSNGPNAGANTLHPFNHYATTTTVDALISLASQWNSAHPGANKLVFNDMSLKWGGLFDVYGNWRGSHSNHSFGTAIDVSKRCIKKSSRAAFIRLIDSLGFSMLSECNGRAKLDQFLG